MTIDAPAAHHLPQLKRLWQEAFGDSDAFTELFFAKGFSPLRCLTATEGERVLGALYWFDYEPGLAYIYGVGVFRSSRGKGVGMALMQKVHDHLQKSGYRGCILCPADAGLFGYYKRLGYTACAPVRTVKCRAGVPAKAEKLDACQYARLRQALLPQGSAVAGTAAVEFLAAYATLLAGEGFVACAVADGNTAYGELLGDVTAAPGIVSSMGCQKGVFRTAGGEEAFAMFLPLAQDAAPPSYLGIALD